MNILFEDCGKPSNRPLVRKVLSEIEQHFMVFIFVSRIFDKYRENHHDRRKIICAAINETLDSPRLRLDANKKRELKELMKDVYKQRNFAAIRAEILESVVYHYGPFTERVSRSACHIEPKIIHNSEIIGKNGRRIDSVFYSSDDECIEFVECKANIASFIPRNLSLGDLKPETREKIEYLGHAYSYLTQHFCPPMIYVACYNENYEVQLHNVRNNWGFSFFQFISPKEMYQCITTRKH